MSSLRKALLKQGLKWMSDPRVIKLMQDERVMRTMMAAMSMPGKAQSFAKEHLESVAKAMALATEAEVRDLRRTVRKLEDDLAEIRADQGTERGSSRRRSA